MNFAIILAGGVGQRMRSSGMPKQFLMVYGKPILIYTIEKFVNCADIEEIVVVCNPFYIDHLNQLLTYHQFHKKISVISGGKDRQASIQNGIDYLYSHNGQDEDIVVIHDGVRPLIDVGIISENIKTALQKGCAMTVKPVIESVVISKDGYASFDNFKKRDDTYSLTSPQTFKLSTLVHIYKQLEHLNAPIPLLDVALAYSFLGNKIPMVMEYNHNIKITTPEDYYILKALVELEENKNVFGIN